MGLFIMQQWKIYRFGHEVAIRNAILSDKKMKDTGRKVYKKKENNAFEYNQERLFKFFLKKFNFQ